MKLKSLSSASEWGSARPSSFRSWDNELISCMSTYAPAWWENTHALYMYVGVRGRGKYRTRSVLFSQGSVARATDWELLVVAIRVTCSLMRKLTRQRGGGDGEGRGGRGAEGMGRAHCSGELISSRGPLFILEGSMEPHCAWGFCSRWFFSIDFSPSALETHVGVMKNMIGCVIRKWSAVVSCLCPTPETWIKGNFPTSLWP